MLGGYLAGLPAFAVYFVAGLALLGGALRRRF